MTFKTKTRSAASISILALAAAAVCLAAPGLALAKTDLSGFWVLKSDPLAVPAAHPTASGAKIYKEMTSGAGLDVADGSLEYAALWCVPYGMPWQTISTLPMDIRQGGTEVTILSAMRAEPRHIYTDGQKHPDLETFDPTTVGHSIGRWQGDTLVADTVGFSDRGVRTMPGGGVRTSKSRLTERYSLSGPDTLKVTYTWTDRTTLARPHSYTLEYSRAPSPVWMPEVMCNPLRAMRAKGLKLPPDAPEF